MKIFTNILYVIFVLLGIILVLVGSTVGAGETGTGGISTVLGGGIFIAFGLTVFVLNRN